MLEQNNDLALILWEGNNSISYFLKKCLRAVRRKAEKARKKTKKHVLKSVKSIKALALMCSSDPSREEEPINDGDHAVEIIIVKEEPLFDLAVQKPADLENPESVSPALEEPICAAQVQVETQDPNTALDTKEVPLSSDQPASSGKAETFITQILEVIKQTSYMRDTLYVAIILFFYLVHNKYTITEELQNAEHAFHAAKKEESHSEETIQDEEMEILVDKCMATKPETTSYISQRKPLEEAYLLLQTTVIALILASTKKKEKSKEELVFYIAVARYIRDTVEKMIGEENGALQEPEYLIVEEKPPKEE